MKKLLIGTIILATTIFLTGCGGEKGAAKEKEVITLRLAENQPPSNPVTKSMEKFAKIVKEKSDGELEIIVYPSAQLGSETENIEQLQMGMLDMARVNSVALSQTISEVGVFALPYIFENNEQKYKVLDGEIGREVSNTFEKYGVMNLGYLEAGTRHFYFTKDVKTLADLKGLKIRVQPSEIAIAMVNALGAVPTPMNYGEVYSSLQTGVIDGAENDFVSYFTSSHHEVAKTLIKDGHLSPPALILIGKKANDKLSKEHQEIIKEAAREATIWEREAMISFNNASEEKVKKAGVKVIEVDKKPFQNAIKDVYSKYPEYSNIIDKINSVD